MGLNVALPRFLDGVIVEQGTESDYRRVEAALGRSPDPEQVWVLISRDIRHIIVAAKIVIRDTTMDIFDSPFADDAAT